MSSSLGVLILFTLLAFQALEVLVEALNLGYATKASLPEELKELYPGDRHGKAKEYLRAQTLFSIQQSNAGLTAFILVWALGLLHVLDSWANSLGFGAIATGLVFWAAIAVAQGLFGLPFRYYHTFVLEERFGFNKTSLKTFMGDAVKGAFVGTLIGAPLLAAVLWFFSAVGAFAWLAVWMLLLAVQLLLAFLAPVLIFPLFFKFEPLAAGELKSAIEAFAAKVSFHMQGVFVIDGSKRSTKANAFFSGMGKSKRIALFDTLLKENSVEETVAVLAHEVGHYQRGHIWKGFFLSTLTTGLFCFGLGFVLRWQELYGVFGFAPSVHAGLFLAVILYGPLSRPLGILSSILSRKHEFEADAYAAETASAAALVTALKRLSDTNLSNPTPHPWKVFLDYRHPPLLQRIRALKG